MLPFIPDPRINSLKDLVTLYSDRYSERAFISERVGKEITSHTFAQFKDDVFSLAAAMIRLGVDGAKVAMICENRYDFMVVYYGTMLAGAAFVPIGPDFPPEKIVGMAAFADCSILVASERYRSLAKIVTENCKAIKTVIAIDEPAEGELGLKALIESGRGYEKENVLFFGDFTDDRTSLMCYTSGTTGGLPKCVMLTAKNIASPVTYGIFEDCFEYMGFTEKDLVYYCPLPMYHIACLNSAFLVSFSCGRNFCTSSSTAEIFRDLAVFKPDFAMFVPALADATYKFVLQEISEANRLDEWKEKTAKWNAEDVSARDRWEYFAQFKKSLGGNLRFMSIVGAKSPKELQLNLRDVGVTTMTEYGQTETAPQVTAGYDTPRIGSVGIPGAFNKVEIRDGIVFIKGANIMKGYYKNPVATAEVLSEDGWLNTGDIGKMDADGFLYITGRASSIVVLSNGENVDIDELSAEITVKVPAIKEIVIIGDKKKNNESLFALIYADPETYSDAEEAEKAVRDGISAINKSLPTYKRIFRFRLVDKPFEKTELMKIKRYLYLNEE